MRKLYLALITGFLFSLFAGSAFADLTDGLVAYYPFEGNADDESINENHGTVHGAADDRLGKADSAYSFNGTDSYITLPDNGFDGLIFGEGTITAWVNPLYSSDSRSIFGMGSSRSVYHYLHTYLYTDGRFGVSVRNGRRLINGQLINLQYGLKTDVSLSDGSWYHLAWVKGPGGDSGNDYNSRLYINGMEQAMSVTRATADTGYYFEDLAPYTDLLTIGTYRRKKSENYFAGKIDELRVYDRALSSGEISQLYTVVPEPASALLYGLGTAWVILKERYLLKFSHA